MQYEYGSSIVNWLHRRTISDATISQFGIKTKGSITIPICDEEGAFLFNKYRRNPFLPGGGPKYWYDKGSPAALFAAHFIKDKKTVVVTEGELDALVLWSHNIAAVTSTSGARTFKSAWAELLADKEVFLCYDNDLAGAQGAVHTLSMVPHAKVILLPQLAGIKDISDYYEHHGDLRNLMLSAKHYLSLDEVILDRDARRGAWLPTVFHEEWIRWYENIQIEEKRTTTRDHRGKTLTGEDAVERAKAVRIDTLVKVNREHKMVCLFHSDKHPSMHVYPDNHAYCFTCGKYADPIDIVRELHHLGFKEAVEWLNNHA